MKLGVVGAQACNPKTLKTEAGELQVQSQHRLHSKTYLKNKPRSREMDPLLEECAAFVEDLGLVPART